MIRKSAFGSYRSKKGVNTMNEQTIKLAQQALAENDHVMGSLIERAEPFTLKQEGRRSPFEALVRAVASQQLHGNAAKAITNRFIGLAPEKPFPEPEDVLAMTDDLTFPPRTEPLQT